MTLNQRVSQQQNGQTTAAYLSRGCQLPSSGYSNLAHAAPPLPLCKLISSSANESANYKMNGLLSTCSTSTCYVCTSKPCYNITVLQNVLQVAITINLHRYFSLRVDYFIKLQLFVTETDCETRIISLNVKYKLHERFSLLCRLQFTLSLAGC